MNAQVVTTTEQEAITEITAMLFDAALQVAEQGEAATVAVDDYGFSLTIITEAWEPTEFIFLADDDALITTSLQDAAIAFYSAINY